MMLLILEMQGQFALQLSLKEHICMGWLPQGHRYAQDSSYWGLLTSRLASQIFSTDLLGPMEFLYHNLKYVCYIDIMNPERAR